MLPVLALLPPHKGVVWKRGETKGGTNAGESMKECMHKRGRLIRAGGAWAASNPGRGVKRQLTDWKHVDSGGRQPSINGTCGSKWGIEGNKESESRRGVWGSAVRPQAALQQLSMMARTERYPAWVAMQQARSMPG